MYLMLSNNFVDTKKCCNINKIYCKVNKTDQSKVLVQLSKRVWLDGQKLISGNQNIFQNQPNAVNKTILFNQLKFFSLVRF